MKPSEIAASIAAQAQALGFSACGVARISDVDKAVINRWQAWIDNGHHASMEYMERYAPLRLNPEGLLPGAKSVISLAMNYFPAEKMPAENPRIAYYAYGRDYHDVMRNKLQSLIEHIQSLAACECRACCDTAPLFERYWAQQAGIGYAGRNSNLILPGKGSYFFLGEVITTLELPPSEPCHQSCGNCRRCIEACPVGAIDEKGNVDARRCISCQTIENRGEIPAEVAQRLGKRLYGCDTCQEVCPHNKLATATTIEELTPADGLKELTYNRLQQLTVEEFRTLFRLSAIKRAKYEGLMRNVAALDATLFNTAD